MNLDILMNMHYDQLLSYCKKLSRQEVAAIMLAYGLDVKRNMSYKKLCETVARELSETGMFKRISKGSK